MPILRIRGRATTCRHEVTLVPDPSTRFSYSPAFILELIESKHLYAVVLRVTEDSVARKNCLIRDPKRVF